MGVVRAAAHIGLYAVIQLIVRMGGARMGEDPIHRVIQDFEAWAKKNTKWRSDNGD